jgi:hypothetical protein
MTSNTDQTLDEIEGRGWGDVPAAASRLVRTVHALRRKPIGQFGVEELRVLLSQQVSSDILVPHALDALERSPFAEGDYYPGDLLVAVLKLPGDYWEQHSDQAQRAEQITATVTSMNNPDALMDVVLSAVDTFRSRQR